MGQDRTQPIDPVGEGLVLNPDAAVGAGGAETLLLPGAVNVDVPGQAVVVESRHQTLQQHNSAENLVPAPAGEVLERFTDRLARHKALTERRVASDDVRRAVPAERRAVGTRPVSGPESGGGNRGPGDTPARLAKEHALSIDVHHPEHRVWREFFIK